MKAATNATMSTKRQAGFSLVEILVVLVILYMPEGLVGFLRRVTRGRRAA